MITEVDRRVLGRAVEVAAGAAADGEQPFAAVLVGADGALLRVEHNRTAGGDPTLHAELLVARWAVANLAPADRASTVLYCSGEPCPMCAGAHGWAGLGRIVYAVEATRIVEWLAEAGVPAPPVRPVPVRDVLPAVDIAGPLPAEDRQIERLRRLFRRSDGREPAHAAVDHPG